VGESPPVEGVRRSVGTPRFARDEVRRTDRRWLLITFVAFVASLLLLAGVYQAYLATKPHPVIHAFERRLQRWAHRIPGL
jgi:hypothetical protein